MSDSNIIVRVPKEIRAYKEKILFGLTIRQTVSTFISVAVCIPLYIIGKKYINEEIISWLVIITAMPLLGIGFIRYNGMPFEKVMMIFLRFYFMVPEKRKYKSDNAWRDWAAEYDKLHTPQKKREKKKLLKYKRQATLERAYLISEAAANGNISFDPDKADLLTVSKMEPMRKKKKLRTGVKMKKNEITLLQKEAAAVERRQSENPEYILTRKDFRVLKKWKSQQAKARIKEIEEGKKKIAKKNADMKKRGKVRTVLPKTVQNSIPFIADFDEGMFEVETNKFSKMYRLRDMNYTLSEQSLREGMFLKYAEFLNYFPEDAHIAICIDNRIVSREEQENKVFFKMTDSPNDKHRNEYNRIMRSRITAGGDDIRVEKYITVTIDADSPIEALLRFHKIDIEVAGNLRKIGTAGEVVSTTERLAYLHDKFRKGHEGEFNIDFSFIKKQGISSKDYIAPSSFVFKEKYLKIDDGFYRVMFLNNLPSSMSDEFLNDLVDNSFPVVTTITFKPVAQDKALKLVRRQLTSVETNKIDAEKRAIRAGYSPETISHKIKDALPEAEQLQTDLTSNNQKLFFATITCMVYGETLEDLEDNCKTLMSKARTQTCQMQILRLQQEEGFRLTLPFGYSPSVLSCDRALTTESSAIFIPFKVQEMFQEGGNYYGQHTISKNLVVCNRLNMQTPSGFVLGSSGSGKTFATKREIINVNLHDDITGILIIDPENEYGDFARAFGGEVIKVSSDSDLYINPMEMEMDYGLDENDDIENTPLSTKKSKAIKKKSEYLMSIVERMISIGSNADQTSITPQQKTIVDRCVHDTFKDYLDSNFDHNKVPTLLDFQDKLDSEAEKEKAMHSGSRNAQDIAEAVAYYTRGSMDVFAHRSNVDLKNRFIVFNIRDLGDQLKQIALIIIFDFIWNRMITNKNKNVRTYCYCDEIHLMFQSYYSANYLKQFYKRGRKYGMCVTGITQNVEDLLKSEQAKGMIGNSQFIMMLNQSPKDIEILAPMLHISDNERQYVTNVPTGSGLLFAEGVKIPFFDEFPKDSYLYKLMSSTFGEEMNSQEIEKKIDEIIRDSQESVLSA